MGYTLDLLLKRSEGKAKGRVGLEGMEWEGRKIKGREREGKEDSQGRCPLKLRFWRRHCLSDSNSLLKHWPATVANQCSAGHFLRATCVSKWTPSGTMWTPSERVLVLIG
jgi:hypothetical protein